MEALRNNVFDCALVFEGGGYRAAYTCAFANVLLEQGIYFDYVCGLSAGASNSVNYLSRDRRRVREAFMTDGVAKGLVGLRSLLRARPTPRACASRPSSATPGARCALAART